jgi:hypothetical protein
MIRVKEMNKLVFCGSWRGQKGSVGFVGLENVCLARGRRTVKQLSLLKSSILGMTTTSFSTAIPSSKTLHFQRCPPPSSWPRY